MKKNRFSEEQIVAILRKQEIALKYRTSAYCDYNQKVNRLSTSQNPNHTISVSTFPVRSDGKIAQNLAKQSLDSFPETMLKIIILQSCGAWRFAGVQTARLFHQSQTRISFTDLLVCIVRESITRFQRGAWGLGGGAFV